MAGHKRNIIRKMIVGTLALVLMFSLLSPSTTNAAANRDWKWPVPASDTISSCYLDGRSHYAIDIVASKGTPIYACYEGTVFSTYSSCTHNYGKSKSCGCSGGLGNYVYIRHTYNGVDYVSRYGHLTSVNVKVGDVVTKDTVIGTMGSTGYSTGHHLDLKIYRGNSKSYVESRDCVDPLKDSFLEIPMGLNANAANTSCCYTYVKEVRNIAFSTGWNFVNGKWYLLDSNKNALTGWHQVDSKWYYMYSDGTMAYSTWVGDYYVDESGAWDTDVYKQCWIQDHNGWWYRHTDGSYTTNGWEYINGNWYLFDERGYMMTGWQQVRDTWYYLYDSGAMAYSTWIGDYYVDESGAWDTSVFKERWIQDDTGWKYRHTDGSYSTNGWEYIRGEWYLFDEQGYMLIGWQKVGDYWYYMYDNGAMACDTYIGGYYVNSCGAWIEETC